MTDHREKLFEEFKENYGRLEEIRIQIKDQAEQLDALHKEAHEIEKEHNFLRRVVHLNIVEDMDPVLAKFKVSEEQKSNPTEKTIGSSGLSYVMIADTENTRVGKIRRMLKAIKEIWNERY